MQIPPQTVREVVALIGAGLVGYGAWLHYPPLGFVAGGALALGLAVLGTILQRPRA